MSSSKRFLTMRANDLVRSSLSLYCNGRDREETKKRTAFYLLNESAFAVLKRIYSRSSKKGNWVQVLRSSCSPNRLKYSSRAILALP